MRHPGFEQPASIERTGSQNNKGRKQQKGQARRHADQTTSQNKSKAYLAAANSVHSKPLGPQPRSNGVTALQCLEVDAVRILGDRERRRAPVARLHERSRALDRFGRHQDVQALHRGRERRAVQRVRRVLRRRVVRPQRVRVRHCQVAVVARRLCCCCWRPREAWIGRLRITQRHGPLKLISFARLQV